MKKISNTFCGGSKYLRIELRIRTCAQKNSRKEHIFRRASNIVTFRLMLTSMALFLDLIKEIKKLFVSNYTYKK